MKRWILSVALMIFLVACEPPTATPTVTPVPTETPTPEPPGFEGFGANATGGEGGDVWPVRNEAELHACIEATGPRICALVPDEAEVWELQESIIIQNGNVTLEAFGMVTLTNHPDNTKATITINAPNVVLRNLRVRPGPAAKSSSNLDALQIIGGEDVMVDHCSFSWAVDEVVSTWYDPQNVTIQWSIIAEGLYHSNHTKGPHSMCLLLGWSGASNISVHHNILAHCMERGPRINEASNVDIVENVIYNVPGNAFLSTPGLVNFVGNQWIEGSDGQGTVAISGASTLPIYVEGNTCDTKCVGSSLDVTEERYDAPPITMTGLERVLAEAGAQPRDAIDARIVADVQNGTGRIIDHPDDVGGLLTDSTKL